MMLSLSLSLSLKTIFAWLFSPSEVSLSTTTSPMWCEAVPSLSPTSSFSLLPPPLSWTQSPPHLITNSPYKSVVTAAFVSVHSVSSLCLLLLFALPLWFARSSSSSSLELPSPWLGLGQLPLPLLSSFIAPTVAAVLGRFLCSHR